MSKRVSTPDFTTRLPADLYHHVIHTLRAALPPPASPDPDAEAIRDNAAMAMVASLLPVNAEEAALAAQYVAAQAQALESLRLMRAHEGDSALAIRCTAQAAAMMRHAAGTRSLLLRVQAARRKRESRTAVCDQEAWTEHIALSRMAEALGRMDAWPRPPALPPLSAPDDAGG